MLRQITVLGSKKSNARYVEIITRGGNLITWPLYHFKGFFLPWQPWILGTWFASNLMSFFWASNVFLEPAMSLVPPPGQSVLGLFFGPPHRLLLSHGLVSVIPWSCDPLCCFNCDAFATRNLPGNDIFKPSWDGRHRPRCRRGWFWGKGTWNLRRFFVFSGVLWWGYAMKLKSWPSKRFVTYWHTVQPMFWRGF